MRPFTPKYTIEDMQELAALRGGRCLSKEYWNTETKLAWQCSKGHVWEATPSHVKRGSWCPGCTKANRQRLTLEQMQQIAKSRGGKCLSERYVNSTTKLKWQCIRGHVWEAMPDSVKGGTWCRVCAYESMRLKIEDMHQTALGRGGKCLSEKYVNKRTKLKWQCSQGHVWEAKPLGVKQGGWCKLCAYESMRLKIEDMHQIALGRGGKCLSEKYINKKTKLRWQCSKGHVWEALPDSVKGGRWCRTCGFESMKLTIEDMQQIARSMGGKCLSDKYVNGRTKLRWQCKHKHIWQAVPSNVKNGAWCPRCAGNMKLTIGQMRKIAKSRGGKCLSDKYIDINTRLKWQCGKGHAWETVPNNVKNGTWCPHCAKQANILRLKNYNKSRRTTRTP